MKVLFVGKQNDKNAEDAARHVEKIFPGATVVFGARGLPKPEIMTSWTGDYIFSYLCPWIISAELLARANRTSINWHPGPPEYPGIGCTNFAIYNGEHRFGITCHHMLAKVDTGRIIESPRFTVTPDDTVFSITQKCYVLIRESFFRITQHIAEGIPLPVSEEHWTRKPYTRKELDALSTIKVDMPIDEIERRIKATTYDKPWAFTELHGRKYRLET